MLNNLNLELHGKDKNIINMISSVNTFKRRLQLLSQRLQCFALFPHMQAELQPRAPSSYAEFISCYEEQVQGILSEFERRFTDFVSIEPVASYLGFPFVGDSDADCIASKAASLFHMDTSVVENEMK